MSDQVKAFVDELVDFVVSFEGIQERHRQFLLGFIEERAASLLDARPLDLHRKELMAALDKSKRIANQRNVTDTERRLMIRDVLSPYLKVASIPANGTAKPDVGVSTTTAKAVSNGTAVPSRSTDDRLGNHTDTGHLISPRK